MKFFRLIDIVVVVLLLLPALFICPLIAIIIYYFEGVNPLFSQVRLSKDKKQFTLYKFRTMSLETLNMPTHEVSETNILKSGKILRKLKFDELPQLWNILVGDMSFVGPRACLPSQKKLIKLREKNNIFQVRSGLTGLPQIHEIDMSCIKTLVKYEKYMIKNMNCLMYLSILLGTVNLVKQKIFERRG